MSKASEYAARVNDVNMMHPKSINVTPNVTVGVTNAGLCQINGAWGFSPVDALRLRDWLTENFEEPPFKCPYPICEMTAPHEHAPFVGSTCQWCGNKMAPNSLHLCSAGDALPKKEGR